VEEMKFCPLMTIARSVAADEVVSHGACQREKCAWWDEANGECALLALTRELHQLDTGLWAIQGTLLKGE